MEKKSGSNWLLIAGGTILVLTTAYLIKSKLFGTECSLKGLIGRYICIKTPFHNRIEWEAPQEEKERIARHWMEGYIRNILLKRSSHQIPPDSIE